MAERLSLLVEALRDPASVTRWRDSQWRDAISLARREKMLGHLAAEVEAAGLMPQLPPQVRALLKDGLRFAAHSHVGVRSIVRQLEAILAPLGCPLILLKGCAYVFGHSPAAVGRLAGDVDMLVPRDWLGAAEAALAAQGWRVSFKSDYDDRYYRDWMHELPPILAPDRSNALDLHHTILPLTSRLRPDASALVAAAVPVAGSRLSIFSPEDEVLHSAVHLFHDGDLTGGLRNLHDLHRMLCLHGREPDCLSIGIYPQEKKSAHPEPVEGADFCAKTKSRFVDKLRMSGSGDQTLSTGFWSQLVMRARLHDVERPLWLALHFCAELFATPVPPQTLEALRAKAPRGLSRALLFWMVRKRLLAMRIGVQAPATRFAMILLYVRSHLLRMPLPMLLRHLWTKWRMGEATKAGSA
jgi:Uncharacterised nucleotidyltransferase